MDISAEGYWYLGLNVVEKMKLYSLLPAEDQSWPLGGWGQIGVNLKFSEANNDCPLEVPRMAMNLMEHSTCTGSTS